MSTPTPSEPCTDSLEDLRRWGTGLLGLNAVDDTATHRRQVLARLEDAEFQPPRAWQEAMDAVFSSPREFRWNDWPEYQRDVEEDLEEEVESFAAAIFDVAPAEREVRWQSLIARCEAFPVLRRRMMGLFPALQIDRQSLTLPEGRVRELGQLALGLVPHPPTVRARTRIAAIELMHSNPDSWEAAARTIQADFPSVASLAPELFDEVAHFSTRRDAVAAVFNLRVRRGQLAAPQRAESRGERGNVRRKIALAMIGAILFAHLWFRGNAYVRPESQGPRRHQAIPSPNPAPRSTFKPFVVPIDLPPESENPLGRLNSGPDLENALERTRQRLVNKKNSGRSLDPDEEEFLRQFPGTNSEPTAAPSEAEEEAIQSPQ